MDLEAPFQNNHLEKALRFAEVGIAMRVKWKANDFCRCEENHGAEGPRT